MYLLELAGEDDTFATLEARSAAEGVEVAAPGVATADDLVDERIRDLAYTTVASRLVGAADATVDAARALVEGTTSAAEGPVAVRARNVRNTATVSTAEAERAVGEALVERGHEVDLDDPTSVCRVVFADDRSFVGWEVARSNRKYGDRRPSDRPFNQPGGMDPLDARAVVILAGAGPNRRVLDPMCGAGGLLVEAALVGASVVGSDAQRRMVRGARENLDADCPDAEAAFLRGDATALPLSDDAVDAVVFDAPYGRQSKVVGGGADSLVAGALREARRVASRGAVVADDDRRAAAEAAGWTVEAVHGRRAHRSLTRYVHVLRADEG